MCVLVCCRMMDGHVSPIHPEARNSSRPWGEAVLFITEWENKSASLCFTCPSWAAWAKSLQHCSVVCNNLKCYYPSLAQRGPDEPTLKAICSLKGGRFSLCEKQCAAKYLKSPVEESWDAGFCCSSPDLCNTPELSVSVQSMCPSKKHMENRKIFHFKVELMKTCGSVMFTAAVKLFNRVFLWDSWLNKSDQNWINGRS